MLKVRNLDIGFRSDFGYFHAIKGVSFDLKKNSTLCIVGESGSGKSVTSLAIMGLLDKEAVINGGEIVYEGRNLLNLKESELRKIRGDKIAMIFQEPMTCLNPSLSIGYQLTETIKLHQNEIKRSERVAKAVQTLELVGLKNPQRLLKEYPFKLSGGQRQRVMIAMAMICKPAILIADEPTTALDVSVQAQVLNLMKELQQKTSMSIIFITHDLGVVSQIADDVLVMYKGVAVESGGAKEVLKNPRHPYTKALLNSLPELAKPKTRLAYVDENIDYLSFEKRLDETF